MGSNTGAHARVSIPSSMRKTIQNIKEIGGNHSDEDVYAMLKECNMDPNETVQRLLFLDTFHEVKRKRDKRKESINGRVSEDFRRKATNHVRGARNGRGNFSSQYVSHDAGGVRKENGYEDRGNAHKSHALPTLKEVDAKMSQLTEKKSPTELPNGIIAVHALQNSGSVDTGFPKDDTNAGPFKIEITPIHSEDNIKHTPSAFDPLLIPKQSCNLGLPTTMAATELEVKSLQVAMDMKDSVHAEKELGSHNIIAPTKNQPGSGKVDVSMVSSSRSENTELLSIQPEINQQILVSEKLSAASTPAIEDSTLELENLKIADCQHVILPNHIQVPDAVKNVLSFGSLGSCFGVGVDGIVNPDSNGKSNQDPEVLMEDANSNQAPEELVEDETAKKTASCDDDIPSSADEENCLDPAPAPVAEATSLPENCIPAPEDNQKKQDRLLKEGPQHAVPVLQTPIYYNSLGPIPPLMGSSPILLEGHDHQHQAYLSTSMNGNPLAMSTSEPTPPSIQSTGAIPSSVVVSVQPVPLLRQPYPPNFIPYGHYLSPFFVPPTLQFVGPGGFPPPLPTGNMYMPAVAATAPGIKMYPPYKLGTNGTNQTPFPIPAGAYAVINSPQAGYAPSTSVTSGVSNANEDIVPSMLKENSIYLGQQNSASMPTNSFFNLPPQGQHIAVTQPGHGAFATMYHPLQTLAAPVAAHPFVQQAQSMPGPADSVGPPQPPPHVFQQPQHHHMNWNSSF